jgi:hypothetical protein
MLPYATIAPDVSDAAIDQTLDRVARVRLLAAELRREVDWLRAVCPYALGDLRIEFPEPAGLPDL